MEEEMAPHVEEIKRALGNTQADGALIEKDLRKLLEFRVPLSEAKRTVIRRYSGGAAQAVSRKLRDAAAGDRNIDITVRVLEVSKKNVKASGTEKTIFVGTVADETAARSFTSWSDLGLVQGSVVHITGAYVRNWQGRPELNFGNGTKVEQVDESVLPSVNTGEMAKLSELHDGDMSVSTVCSVLEVSQKEIVSKDTKKKTILACVIADDTAKMPMTSWVVLPEIAAGNTIRISNAYVKSFRGIPSLHISEFSKVSVADGGSIMQPEQRVETIDSLYSRDGAFDIMVKGNVMSVRAGSGLITRCPQCSRVIQKGMCRVHGRVEGVPDLRVKSILDDGTGALTLVLNSKLTESLCGMNMETANRMAESAMSANAVEEEMKRKLVGRLLTVRGNASKSEFGVTLVAESVSMQDVPMQDEAAVLLKDIRGMAYA